MTIPNTIHVQRPAPTIADFDSWLWRHNWVRNYDGSYVNMATKEFKSVKQLWEDFATKK